ncbi:hypothetical protein LUX01_04445 [Streptomyces sudanensis]|uniref:hypothetical protein n=1 Tax=Streptomyces sudanensis TaxID=436397 RepID=UPI0020CCC8AD|nr:hypothetical protein [Streptomyces sudanensis]MCP9986077.1 hypothetical protein [Streptomyces sudanensis]
MTDGAIRRPAPQPDRRSTALLVLATAETAITAVVSLCWLLLALAMYMESYDLDPSAPGQPRGHAELAYSALGTLASLAVTWSLRLAPRRVVRHAVNGLIAVRLAFVLLLTAVLAVDLLNG